MLSLPLLRFRPFRWGEGLPLGGRVGGGTVGGGLPPTKPLSCAAQVRFYTSLGRKGRIF